QARVAVEKHLANWVKSPTVTLTAHRTEAPTAAAATTDIWRPAGSSGAVLALNQAPGIPDAVRSAASWQGKEGPMPPADKEPKTEGKKDEPATLPYPQTLSAGPPVEYHPGGAGF